MKHIGIIVVCLLLIAAGGYWYFMRSSSSVIDNTPTPIERSDDSVATSTATSTDASSEMEGESVLGTSADDHEIMAYHFGTGDDEILFIGGIHGGYSWNTALVAYDLIDYLQANEDTLPENLRVTVIPVLNPDGLEKTVGTTTRFAAADAPTDDATRTAGRFNSDNVDLNRNFDCEWQATGTWRNQSVSGGSAPFSEPETAALRDYVSAHKPTAVIAWFSAAGGVYASSCTGEVSAGTLALTNIYADAAGYEAYEDFDFYAVTGDMLNWFAKNNTPAISVLLTNHTDTEWSSKNRAGVAAVLQYYGE